MSVKSQAYMSMSFLSYSDGNVIKGAFLRMLGLELQVETASRIACC